MKRSAVAIVSLGLCALVASPASSASTTTIAGTVVNVTSGGRVAGIDVVLHTFQSSTETGTQTVATDVRGAFAFGGLTPDATTSYQVTTRYQHVGYTSGEIRFTAGATNRVTVKIYETTTDPSHVTITSWVVWVDSEGNGAAVQQDLHVKNSGTTTYVGAQRLPGGGRAVWQVPLAPGAENFQFMGAFMGVLGAPRDGVFVNPSPIPPGTSLGVLRYTVPSPSALRSLSFRVPFATANFSVLVPTGVGVSADRLTRTGQTTDRGITYEQYTATNLAAGEEISVGITGLEPQAKGAPLLPLLAGMLVLIAIAVGIVWRMRRGAAVPAPREPSRPSQDRRPNTAVDDELLIDEIAALDLAHDDGLLDDETFRRLRADAKDRLIRSRS